MKPSIAALALGLLALTPLPSFADDYYYGEPTPFGAAGTGRPTNTIVGGIAGAATGAAIGQAVGGKDGWWIGSLIGTAFGGTVGNAWSTHDSPRVVHRRVHVVEPVYYPEPVLVEPVPVVSQALPPGIPYGYLGSSGYLKSPWSDFQMEIGGLNRGQTVYDAKTGQPFLVP
jgi:hypothetical protein